MGGGIYNLFSQYLNCRKSADFTLYIVSTFAPAILIYGATNTAITSISPCRSVLKNPISEVLTVGFP